MEVLNIMRNAVVTFQIQDALDILIVTFLLYTVFKLFKNTSGIQILRGIILILLISQVSALLNLYVLNYIFSGALQLGILALVIVFQPDLRNLLEQLGRKGLKFQSLFIKTDSAGSADLIRSAGMIADACARMAKEKTGALIVLQNATQLGDIINTGTVLNADVSESLIENIFFKNSPLHDGAAIISGNQVLAAGCVLPLSKNDLLSKDLGTRHRAGVGITEQGDAIAIIVSEETGSISVAEGGILKRHLTIETLTRILENALIPSSGRQDQKDGIFRRIIGLWRKAQ